MDFIASRKIVSKGNMRGYFLLVTSILLLELRRNSYIKPGAIAAYGKPMVSLRL
jgi:hypothetical protein